MTKIYRNLHSDLFGLNFVNIVATRYQRFHPDGISSKLVESMDKPKSTGYEDLRPPRLGDLDGYSASWERKGWSIHPR